jgi:hypothetical protein
VLPGCADGLNELPLQAVLAPSRSRHHQFGVDPMTLAPSIIDHASNFWQVGLATTMMEQWTGSR